MKIIPLFDSATSTLTYILIDEKSRHAAVIDPVWDYDQGSSTLSNKSFHDLCDLLEQHQATLKLVMETHAHADHVSSSQLLKTKYPDAVLCVGRGITEVQSIFRPALALGPWFKTDGSQFDRLLDDGDVLNLGETKIRVLSTPGHTPACCSFLVGKYVFTGDSLFLPDCGTGRCDFPGGGAKKLYRSLSEKIFKLDEDTVCCAGHDYPPNQRSWKFGATVKEQRESNIHIRSHTTEEEYVKFREARDKTLAAPRLLLPSIQINADAGHLPPKNILNGKSYLSIPISAQSIEEVSDR